MQNEERWTAKDAGALDQLRREAGVVLHAPGAPFRTIDAARDGSGNDGGLLDRGIVATLPDGREVVVGELWAAGHASDGDRISLDVLAFGRRVVEALNGGGDPGETEAAALEGLRSPDLCGGGCVLPTGHAGGCSTVPVETDAATDMRCIGCGEIFDSEDEAQSRFHESACQEFDPDARDVVAEISRRLRQGRRST